MPSGIYKRTEKTRRILSESRKGVKHWNYGKPRLEETRKRISEAHKGLVVSKTTREKISKSHMGRTVSEETRQKIRGKKNFFYGKHYYRENNGNWKGGISSLENLIRSNFKSRQWRDDIYSRDNFTCQGCGNNKGHNLNAHHIKTLSSILQKYEITTLEEALTCEELWNLNNGITLCAKCHNLEHDKKNKIIKKGVNKWVKIL